MTGAHGAPSLISCSDLTKRYGRKTVFSGLGLSIPAGGVCALLGRNGAGKTTLLRLALGLARPTSGQISLLGRRPGSANSLVGFMGENVAIYPHLSAVDNLRVAFNSAGLRPPPASSLLELLERVSLSTTGRKPAGGFSLGMKRRLQLATATMVRPVDLLLLDEPTNGLDLDGVTWLRQFVAAAPARGTSVIVSSHDLATLQPLVTHVSILHEGSVVVNAPWRPESAQLSLEETFLAATSGTR
jgi:ABC-2 type transport system ATP-binding protein